MFTNDMVFGIRTVYIRKHASLYADENSLDFYMYFYDDFDKFQPKYMSSFLYNGYTISLPKPFNLRYGTVNWYGGSGITNEGVNIPTFIRLAGYLTSGEIRQGSNRLCIFFSGLDFFYDELTENNTNFSVSCSSSVGSTPTYCRAYDNIQPAA